MLGPDPFIVGELVRRERELRLFGPMQHLKKLFPWQLSAFLFAATLLSGTLAKSGIAGPWPTVTRMMLVVWVVGALAVATALIIGAAKMQGDRVSAERIEAGLRRLAALCSRLLEEPVTDPATGDQLMGLLDSDARTLIVIGPEGPSQSPMVIYTIGEYGVHYRIFIRDEELPSDAVSLDGRIGGRSSTSCWLTRLNNLQPRLNGRCREARPLP